ncbi:VOC family protein [Halobacillus sp. A5]|uniref:VOC family protein n=1 Tax=Halobacillus sp. A5 TaxID=2880263 RepID=UPI0020A67654|nr:VOC family protein [Halobacillus sp. A5]MCP3027759.1 VOC family protein [Halobacillus sp. A5]
MRPRVTVLTLGVEDLEKSLEFYKNGLGLPTEGIIGQEFDNGAVAFFQLQHGLKLAIWERKSLAAEANVAISRPSSSEFTIGHNVSSKNEVDEIMQEAEAAGAEITDPAKDTFWGGYSGHFLDVDGHLWEVVWNPAWELED